MNVEILDDAAFCWWLVGFTDGEGCLGVSRNGGWRNPFYQLILRRDSRPILEYVQGKLGIGSLYDCKGSVQRAGYISKPTSIYMVRKIGELDLLVSLFDRYSLRIKQAQFFVWRSLIEERYKACPPDKRDRGKIAEMAETLCRLKRYSL